MKKQHFLITNHNIFSIIIALLLIFTTVLSFAACSDGDTDKTLGNTTAVTSDAPNLTGTKPESNDPGSTAKAEFKNETLKNAFASCIDKKADDITVGDCEKVKVLFLDSMGLNIAYEDYVSEYEKTISADYPLKSTITVDMKKCQYETVISSYEPEDLALFKNVEYLAVTNASGKVKLSDYACFKYLRHLVVFMSDCSSLDGINSFSKLESLTVGSNTLSDISALSENKTIKTLWITYTQKITDWTAVSSMTQLEFVSLDSIAVSDIDFVKTLTNLKRFQATGNQLKDISPLFGLTELRIINVNLNSISSIKGISALKNLVSLDINNSSFDDISELYGLTSLKRVNLSANTAVSEEQIKQLAEKLPGADIMYSSGIPTTDNQK